MSRGHGSLTQAMTLAGIELGEQTDQEDAMPTVRLVVSLLLCAPFALPAQAEDLGKLSANPYDPDSNSNPFGRYGSPYSPDFINNPFGAANPYRLDSPNNPYGQGWRSEGR